MTEPNNGRIVGQIVDIATADGVMDGYAAYPERGGRFPLVVMFMDIWGLREELFALMRRVASHGYYCIVPNLFYRSGKKTFARYDAAGKMMSFDLIPPDVQDEMLKLGRGIDRAMVRSDVGGLLDFCRGQPVSEGPAGTVGFCLGGRIAFLAAQEYPDRFRATASLHGVFLVTDAPDSPHRLVSKMHGEVYCGHAEHDKFSAPHFLSALAGAFDGRSDPTYRSRFHPGADHGYSLPDRDIHDAAAAEADWSEIFAMFARQLHPAD
ncbi:MAG: dienelactone hydrolase family protein [Rhodopseudomonas sp.]|nr:dienelactone hydrolase family protein [Rhodopseudomonas sp.]